MSERLSEMRRWYAEGLRLCAPVLRNMAVIEAFAAVPRERFLGPGPWRISSLFRSNEPVATPDDEPHWVYHDVVVSIDESRALNNGMPSLWAYNFDQLDLRPGERVMQVGAGTGYYAAILAEMVGADGRITAVEHDEDLAGRARSNLAPWRQIEVVAGDGRTHDPGPVDAVVVFAGSTHPASLWLDRLNEGGRLIMPLTADNRWGFMLRAVRREATFDAGSTGRVGFFPCLGGRDEEAGNRLQLALQNHPWPAEIPIVALHCGELGAAMVNKAWYHGPGFWLERQLAGPHEAASVDAVALSQGSTAKSEKLANVLRRGATLPRFGPADEVR
jgi:protein-L-isoaspartate(D-aspartate) O-methyltransferase